MPTAFFRLYPRLFAPAPSLRRAMSSSLHSAAVAPSSNLSKDATNATSRSASQTPAPPIEESLPDDSIFADLIDVHSHAHHAISASYTSYSDPACHASEAPKDVSAPSEDARRTIADALASVRTSAVCMYGTRPNDFKAVALHRKLSPKVVPGYALHPWFVESVGPTEIPEKLAPRDVLDLLRATDWGKQLLDDYLIPAIDAKEPIVLAEFGLDRAATKPGTKEIYDFDTQLKLFRLQLLLGAELNLPVSIHCVRAFGHIYDVFASMKEDELPPRIMMHSFGGKQEILHLFLKKLSKPVRERFYFSFSPLNLRPAAPSFLAQIPANRLLLESDVHSPQEIDGAMWKVCKAVAEGLGWTPEECAKRTGENARIFLGIS